MSRPNIPILLLSILLSSSVWFIRFGQNLSTQATVPIKLSEANVSGLKTNLLHVDFISPFKLQLSGPAGQVAKVEYESKLDMLISVDLSEAVPGQRSYPLVYDNSIKALVKGPLAVPVKIEEIISKTVPVKIEPRGKLNDADSSLESYPPSQSSAVVRGPKSIVDLVEKARAVLEVDQIDPSNPKTQEAALVAVDAKEATYSVDIQPPTVVITPIVTAAQVKKTVVVSPRIEGTPAFGYIPTKYKLTPPQITLTGPTSTLMHTSNVVTEKVDVNGLTGSKLFKVPLVIPRGTTSTVSSVYIRFEVARDPAFKKSTAIRSGASTGILPTQP